MGLPRPKGRHGLVDHDIPGAGLSCTYCQRHMMAWSPTHPTKDHTIPKSRGGLETVWACYQCNQLKADMMPDEWAQVMRNNPRWWTVHGLGARLNKHPRRITVCPVLEMVARFFYEKRYGVWTPRNP